MATTLKPSLFEDFKPVSQLKEEPESHILTVHLPDFTKEQIRITCVKSSRMVRVHGQKQLADKKWRRFNEGFPVPENCKIDNIHAKWHNGSLIVTMPKEIITQNIAPKEELKTVPPKTTHEPLPSKQEADAKTKTTISEKQDDKKSTAFVPSPKATPSIHREENQTDGKRVLQDAHQKDEKETNLPQKGAEETSHKLAPTKQTDDKTGVPNYKPDHNLELQHKERTEPKKEKPSELKKPENVVDTSVYKESSAFVPKTTSEKRKVKLGQSKEEPMEKKSIAAGALKAVTEQNGERQLMVNMGVAVLVIFALGAYVSYSFASKSKSTT